MSLYSIGYEVPNPQGRKNAVIFVEVMSYAKFRHIMEQYFDRAKTRIISGECISIKGGIGKVCAKRVQRNFKGKASINWKLTRQQPLVWSAEKGRLVYSNVIYYTGNDWCRIAWYKAGCVANDQFYKFVPAAGNGTSKQTVGFIAEFRHALNEDPFLKFRYLYEPLKPKRDGSTYDNIDTGSDGTGGEKHQDTGLLATG